MNSQRLRVAGLIALSSLAGLAAAQNAGKTITFSQPAARASVLIPALAKATGLDLRTTAKTENDVLQIQVNDVTVKDLLSRIAQVSGGEWVTKGHTLSLTRSDLADRKAEDKLYDTRLRAVQAFIDRNAAEVKGDPQWNDQSAAQFAKAINENLTARDQEVTDASARRARQKATIDLVHHLPDYVAVHSIVDQIGAKALVPLLYGQRLVFALHPTAMQIAMPAGAGEILTKLVESEKQLTDAYRQLTAGPDNGQDRRIGRQFGRDQLRAPVLGSGDPSLGIGGAILTIYRGSQPVGNTFSGQVSLTVADTKGQTIFSTDTDLSGVFQFQPFLQGPGHGEEMILSPLAMELTKFAAQPLRLRMAYQRTTMYAKVNGIPDTVAFSSAMGGQGQAPRTSDELRRVLLDPEGTEPLSLVVGEALSKSATSLKQNLVADLPDTCFQPYAQFFADSNGHFYPADVVDKAFPALQTDVRRDHNWLLISPDEPAENLEHRVDRRALAKLVRSMTKDGTVHLEEAGALAVAKHGATADYDLEAIYLQLVDPGLGAEAMTMLANPDALKIYTLLSPGEKALGETKGSIQLTELDPKQAAWLYDEIFNSFVGLVSDRPGPMSPQTRRPRTDANLGPVISEERTIALPNGIPPSGRLQISSQIDAGVIGLDSNNVRGDFQSKVDLAARIFQRDKPFLGTPTLYTSFCQASRTRITLRFIFAEGWESTYVLNDIALLPSAKAVAFNELPSDFQKDVQDMVDKIQQSPLGRARFNTNTGPRRGANPPP